MIEKSRFGRTNHLSTRTIFGAAALGTVTQLEADRTLDLLLEYGVNHIDTAASYGDSEKRLASWMKHHRADFFLATKTEKRSYAEAKIEIHRSLQRLEVEQIDLIQLHCLIDQNQWDVAMNSGGALEAALEAREAGLVRFIGVTGHGLSVAAMHKQSLQHFDFDSVLLPWNYLSSQNAEYAREFREVETLCRTRDVALQTIKSITRRPWGEQTRTASCWYQPLEDQDAIDRAVWWLLAQPGLFLNTVGDIHVLPRVLDAAKRFEKGCTPDEMKELVANQQMAPLFV